MLRHFRKLHLTSFQARRNGQSFCNCHAHMNRSDHLYVYACPVLIVHSQNANEHTDTLTAVYRPVSLDHCFARIILDAVTEDTPWMNKIKSPAYKHMTEEQLRRAIQIGHEVKTAEVPRRLHELIFAH